jgi:hypothetical protein
MLGMFICDEMQAESSPAAAATRLAALTRGSALTRASHTAWGAGVRIGQDSAAPALVRVQCQGPAHPDAAPLLILRWEAAAGSAQPFPVLDADITLAPAGDHAVLLSLAGVYRTPPGTRPDDAAARRAAAVTAHVLLCRLTAAISDPVPPTAQPRTGNRAPRPHRDLRPYGERRPGT